MFYDPTFPRRHHKNHIRHVRPSPRPRQDPWKKPAPTPSRPPRPRPPRRAASTPCGAPGTTQTAPSNRRGHGRGMSTWYACAVRHGKPSPFSNVEGRVRPRHIDYYVDLTENLASSGWAMLPLPLGNGGGGRRWGHIRG